MILHEYPYIDLSGRTGDLLTDVRSLLERNGKPQTFRHVRQVAAVCAELADRFGLERDHCMAAGLLHDISAVIKPVDMLTYAQKNGFVLCEAELRYPSLLHQRLSVLIAQEYFGITDARVLSAIECHTTLKADPAREEEILFLADKLAWDQEGIPPFYDAVYAALEYSPEKACHVYMRYMVDNGRLLCPHSNWIAALHWLEKTIG
ncbi:MAG: HD domain-containing protein [Clostridia bacterium]|nr:HD domain-containing protein [Clostridia bacterium]